jgi:plasmid stabilization system protein ParE
VIFGIEVLDSASADLQYTYDWYEEQSVALDDRFIKEVDVYFDLICENPFMYPVHFSEIYHFALLKNFPFRIDDIENCVYVSSVFHTSRNPKDF